MEFPPKSRANLANLENSLGWSPLHEAVDIGRKDLVEALIAQGAQVSLTDNNLRAPLHIAAIQGHKEIAEILIAAKAEINPLDLYECTPLVAARMNLHDDVVELLAKHGGLE